MKAMILAAGFGTRFRPATLEVPKPLIPLCNRPLIDYAIDPLLSFGIREIVVNLHHLPAPIEKHLVESYAGRCRFQFFHEPEIFGTGGGVRNARGALEGEEGFFLVNGDTIQLPPFGRLQRALEETGALAALLLRHRPPGETYTAVYFDGTYVTGFGAGEGEALMFSGSHAISGRIFDHLPDRPFSGLTEDVYQPILRDRREKLAGAVDDGLWFDIGTPHRYMSASEEMRKRMLAGDVAIAFGSVASSGSIVDATATIRGVVEESAIGAESIVERGARVARSAVWRGCVVEGDVEETILCDGVRIPSRASVVNALVCRRDGDLGALPGLQEFGDIAAVPIDPAKRFRVLVE